MPRRWRQPAKVSSAQPAPQSEKQFNARLSYGSQSSFCFLIAFVWGAWGINFLSTQLTSSSSASYYYYSAFVPPAFLQTQQRKFLFSTERFAFTLDPHAVFASSNSRSSSAAWVRARPQLLYLIYKAVVLSTIRQLF